MAKGYVWFSLFVITCFIQVNSAATVNSSDVGNYSETYNGNNGNAQSYPVTFIQNGSPVDKSSVATIDQYLGNIKVNVSKRSIPPFVFEPAVVDYYQQHHQQLEQFLHEFENFNIQ